MHNLTSEEIRQALSYIDAHNRDTWVRMAMAVKSELGESGFAAWNDWSATASNYREKDARTVWRSVKPIRITIASLVAESRANGWVSPKRKKPLDPESIADLERRKQDHLQRQKREKARIESNHERAAKYAKDLLAESTLQEHHYLKDKHLGEAKGLVLPDGALFIPMRNWRDNALQGAQIIRLVDNQWQKKMLPGMRAKGAVLRIGPRNATEAMLCEGYATGLSIELAARRLCLSMAVIVCFSDGNLVHLSSLLTGRRYVFADNDRSQAGERAAKKTGLPYCMSPQLGEDANDLYARAGLMAVCKLLMEVRRG